MTEQTETIAVRQSIVVRTSQERAFRVFTEDYAAWWPLDTHHIGSKSPVTAVIEPRVGGRWFERAADGTECDTGRVLAWEPPARLVLAWQISADYRYDPSVESEIEVRFTAEAEDRTRVELEHRGLEAYGAEAETKRREFGSPGGWPGLLERFAAAAAPAGDPA
jgi:uncharacterized protein YndB with AHSA1/START domain